MQDGEAEFLYNANASPLIINCLILNNIAGTTGGGISFYSTFCFYCCIIVLLIKIRVTEAVVVGEYLLVIILTMSDFIIVL